MNANDNKPGSAVETFDTWDSYQKRVNDRLTITLGINRNQTKTGVRIVPANQLGAF